MPDGPATDKWLGHIFHLNCRLHSRFYSDLRASALQGQTVDHSREHSHVIGGGAIHPAMGGRSPAPDVSPTADNADLHVKITHFLNSIGDCEDNLRRNVFPRAGRLESFAAQFKDDAFVRGSFRLHRASNMAHRRGNENKNASVAAVACRGLGLWLTSRAGDHYASGHAENLPRSFAVFLRAELHRATTHPFP